MNIVVIGCGYLGRAVAKEWTSQGHHVTATTRHPEKLSELSKYAQKSVILKGNDEEAFIPLIANNEVILITIAADSLQDYESAYLDTARIFKKLALEMDMPRDLIYVSSTSVYGDYHGRWVDEESKLLGKSEQAKILIEAEKIYTSLSEIGWDVCILRLSEIYGPSREISKKLKKRMEHKLPGTGEQYTNMVHLDDCVNAIIYCLNHHLEGVYNLSDDDHPTYKELYDQVVKKFHLPKVHWDPSVTSLHGANKRIANHKIKKSSYSFICPHRILN